MAEKIYEKFEQYIVPPSWENKIWDLKEYKEFYESTVKDKTAIEKWWGKWANELFWFKKWDNVLDDSNPPFYRWFVGAETNLAYLYLDWQIQQGRRNKVALIWEGEPYDEGAPDAPGPDRWWDIIERYAVTIFYIYPLAKHIYDIISRPPKVY